MFLKKVNPLPWCLPSLELCSIANLYCRGAPWRHRGWSWWLYQILTYIKLSFLSPRYWSILISFLLPMWSLSMWRITSSTPSLATLLIGIHVGEWNSRSRWKLTQRYGETFALISAQSKLKKFLLFNHIVSISADLWRFPKAPSESGWRARPSWRGSHTRILLRQRVWLCC